MKIFNKLLDIVGSMLFFAMVVVMIIQIIGRFVLKISIPWTEEMSRLLFLYVVFFGAAIASRNDSHLIIDTVSAKVPDKYKNQYKVIITLLSIAVMTLFLIGSIKMIPVAKAKVFQTIKLNQVWTYIAPITGFSLMIFYSILNLNRLIARIKAGKEQ